MARLFEHPDFDQAVIGAAEALREAGSPRLRESFVEKDYYVTEALRALVAAAAPDRIIFKGGTSLSKGWGLIQRFSEDIDIFLDPGVGPDRLGKNAVDRELKRLRDAVAAHPGLTFDRESSRTVGGFGRSDSFTYAQKFGGPGEAAGRVLVEAGTASGREPTEVVAIESFVARFLRDSGVSLGAEDESSFPVRLLHFRRTFVEKLFAIHAKVELLKRDREPLGGYARHYYDLYRLAARGEVRDMLASAEYTAIKEDYDRVSRAHFAKNYFAPPGMSFAGSEALFPAGVLRDEIAAEFARQCEALCHAPYPTWEEFEARLAELRGLL